MDMHKKNGLSNDAITMIERAHETAKHPKDIDITKLLSELLSDRNFYVLSENVNFHMAHIKKPKKMDPIERDKKYLCANIVGYSK